MRKKNWNISGICDTLPPLVQREHAWLYTLMSNRVTASFFGYSQSE